MDKNVFIIGSRGYRNNYGGWETLTKMLVDYYDDKHTHFYVTEITNDKSKDKKIENIKDNLYVVNIYTKAVPGATMFLNSIKAFNFCTAYVQSKKLDNVHFCILGLKLYNKLKTKRKLLKQLNIKTYVNPDGLEWKRSKWPGPVKKFFLRSEKLMLNYADVIVCDALGIKDYVNKKYPHLANRCVYIAYGCEAFNFDDIDQKAVLNEYNLLPQQYCLMVGRCVPEDNYELVIKDFMASNIDKQLVIITNLSSGSYYKKLLDVTGCQKDNRIKFIDGVYDRKKLAAIRKNAYLYIHGHSVGGTNPSLIEAMSLTDLNILFDVCFNKDIGQDACLYFKEPGSLSEILNNSEQIDQNKAKFGTIAKDIVKNNFTWDIIVDKYEDLFNEAN